MLYSNLFVTGLFHVVLFHNRVMTNTFLLTCILCQRGVVVWHLVIQMASRIYGQLNQLWGVHGCQPGISNKVAVAVEQACR